MTTTLAPSARQNRTIQVSLSAAGPARGLLLSALFALFLPAFAALAEAPVPSVPSAVPGQPHTYYPQGLPAQAAEPAPAASLLPPLSVTEHTLRLAGGDLRYTAKAGPLPLRDGKGETLAEIFHVAYVREPQDPKRPITFVFNGGPGAASAYLHLGAMGPKAIAASDKGEVLGPPPRLSDNEFDLAPLHRPRFRRSRRHWLQPRRRAQRGEGLLRRRAGHRGARRFHPALSH